MALSTPVYTTNNPFFDPLASYTFYGNITFAGQIVDGAWNTLGTNVGVGLKLGTSDSSPFDLISGPAPAATVSPTEFKTLQAFSHGAVGLEAGNFNVYTANGTNSGFKTADGGFLTFETPLLNINNEAGLSNPRVVNIGFNEPAHTLTFSAPLVIFNGTLPVDAGVVAAPTVKPTAGYRYLVISPAGVVETLLQP